MLTKEKLGVVMLMVDEVCLISLLSLFLPVSLCVRQVSIQVLQQQDTLLHPLQPRCRQVSSVCSRLCRQEDLHGEPQRLPPANGSTPIVCGCVKLVTVAGYTASESS